MSLLGSIRWRLQLWHGLLLLAVLAGFFATALRLQEAGILRTVDQDLTDRVGALVAALHPGPGGRPFPPPGPGGLLARGFPEGPDTFPPPGPPPPALPEAVQRRAEAGNAYFRVWARDGRERDRSTGGPEEVPLPDSAAGHRGVRQRGTLREVYHILPEGARVLVGRDIQAELDEGRRAALLLGIAGAAVLVAGLAGGWWISVSTLRPIGEIAATAARIHAGDLSRRIPVRPGDNELDRLAAALNDTFDRLEAAFATQARFTADAAHELRTPISILLTHAENGLADPCAEAEHRRAFEAILRAARRMRDLTESLLTLARVEGAARTFDPCDLAQVAEAALAPLRPRAEAQGLVLETDLAPAPCRGQARQLEQVVGNLVGNALAYNRPGGAVRVRVAPLAGGAELTVSDTGPGIAPQDLPHLFERFFRGDRARSGEAGHSGLGLAICKAIVEAHGGRIRATSQLGEGSRFTVRLPGR
jgi:signal transduction histidine kinase